MQRTGYWPETNAPRHEAQAHGSTTGVEGWHTAVKPLRQAMHSHVPRVGVTKHGGMLLVAGWLRLPYLMRLRVGSTSRGTKRHNMA